MFPGYVERSTRNAWRKVALTDSPMANSLERLSSGLRINRAADDAAGLAISQKTRAQVRGLNQAIRNTQDGVSLLKAAEGAPKRVSRHPAEDAGAGHPGGQRDANGNPGVPVAPAA